ncbi:hypothetical protein BH10ACT11_BH10ACT11_05380 [soil metagenome]
MVIGSAAATAGSASLRGERGGGVAIPDPPKVADAFCSDRCAGIRKATEGSKIELDGKNLSKVKKVSFDTKGNDRISVKALTSTKKMVVAKVPKDATTGKPRVKGSTGSAGSPAKIEIVGKGAIPPAGSFKLQSAEASPNKAYFDGKRPATLVYGFKGGRKVDVRVDIVDAKSGALVESLVDRDAKPFADNKVRWDGKTQSGKQAPNGKYKFKVGALRGSAPKAKPKTAFGLYSHEFPLRAKHSYGDGFGSGRGHEGQDVFARCGSKIVVARGGKVTFNKFQSAAGNYVVIDGKGTNHDYMYAHLRKRSPLKTGKHVKTGQFLGNVGQTGDAVGCHLHFEFWKGPWQQGGQPLASVTRMLKKWDKWS